ncbi:glycosyltransferase family 2 protein [Mycolicibacterium sp. BiH015]|uniref:glycosyltransferase family 2 protein n=1 Tax=Mycolicibacterium sp. BiH015 TaxID=3018808 RepID=UPI0022E7E307|nr:galactosyltransferase-related protein [Mycolicibacterium sp. BiH015]MDA2891180.1 glycosyltransferase family 2 protein [Mycolicibacterium sp. BiH015]
MKTAVVTVVHGRHGHLRQQIRGLGRGCAPPDVHVVVALGDPDVGHVVRSADSAAVVLDCPAGSLLPLAAARNRGAEAALDDGAELLVFLDVDCIPSTRLLQRYHAVAGEPEHRNALLCGPVTYLPPAGKSGYDLSALDQAIDPHPARPSPLDGTTLPTTDYSLFWSLSFALTGTTWHAIGGFCEEYRGYGGEDTDFGFVAAARGVPMRWVGGAHAFHQHHHVSDPPVEHVDDIVRNSLLFHQRWGQWPMEGWLKSFESTGLIERDDDGTPRLVP